MILAVESVEDKKTKISQIVIFRHVLPMERYTDFLNENINLINTESLFQLLVEKRITYNDVVLRQFVDRIELEDRERRKQPGLRTFPDWLKASINYCIILKLVGYHVDLTMLKPYAHYSEHLQFMLNPDDFDYTYVDTSNYMWQNLIYSSYYKDYFLEHKKELISDELRMLFDMGVETREQQKIVYGLLLDEDELREFGV